MALEQAWQVLKNAAICPKCGEEYGTSLHRQFCADDIADEGKKQELEREKWRAVAAMFGQRGDI